MPARNATRRTTTANAASSKSFRPQAAALSKVKRRRLRRLVAIAAAVLVSAGAVVGFVASRDGSGGGREDSAASAPEVGADLHTVQAIGTTLFIGGHSAVVKSIDGGRTWRPVPSLAGADAMGWAVDGPTILVGGHPGLFRSTDGGETFGRVTGAGAIPDVHALGGAGSTVYAASPQAGLLVSHDGGASWEIVNGAAGRSFMGTLYVDPDHPTRLIAPDMSSGLVASADGGRTWTALGGPAGAMALTVNPANPQEIIAIGTGGSARSVDGGAHWQAVSVPSGTSAAAFDPAGRILYAAALAGQHAVLYRSTNGGLTFTPTAAR